jgi:hypothetical protein
VPPKVAALTDLTRPSRTRHSTRLPTPHRLTRHDYTKLATRLDRPPDVPTEPTRRAVRVGAMVRAAVRTELPQRASEFARRAACRRGVATSGAGDGKGWGLCSRDRSETGQFRRRGAQAAMGLRSEFSRRLAPDGRFRPFRPQACVGLRRGMGGPLARNTRFASSRLAVLGGLKPTLCGRLAPGGRFRPFRPQACMGLR